MRIIEFLDLDYSRNLFYLKFRHWNLAPTRIGENYRILDLDYSRNLFYLNFIILYIWKIRELCAWCGELDWSRFWWSQNVKGTFFFFFLSFWRTHVLFGGHWYPCFWFLVMSPLGFKARVGSALFTIFAEANVMYIPQESPLVLHLPTSWRPARSRSLPHMHVQRWDLAQIRTCNHTNRRRTCYHCASDPIRAL